MFSLSFLTSHWLWTCYHYALSTTNISLYELPQLWSVTVDLFILLTQEKWYWTVRLHSQPYLLTRQSITQVIFGTRQAPKTFGWIRASQTCSPGTSYSDLTSRMLLLYNSTDITVWLNFILDYYFSLQKLVELFLKGIHANIKRDVYYWHAYYVSFLGIFLF